MTENRVKVLNPSTNRYVYASGSVGKALAAQLNDTKGLFNKNNPHKQEYKAGPDLDTALRISQEEYEIDEHVRELCSYMSSDEQQNYPHMDLEDKRTLCKLLSERHYTKIQCDLDIKKQQDEDYKLSLQQDASIHARQGLLARQVQLENEEKLLKEDFRSMYRGCDAIRPDDHTQAWENLNVKIDSIRTEMRTIHTKLQD